MQSVHRKPILSSPAEQAILGTLRRILGYGREAWEGNRHYEMPLLFKECLLLPGNGSVALDRFEYLKQRFPSVQEQSGGRTQIFNKKKAKKRRTYQRVGQREQVKKGRDQLIKKFICEETYDASHSQNCLSTPPPFLPPKRKSLEGRCRLMKATSCRLLVV